MNAVNIFRRARLYKYLSQRAYNTRTHRRDAIFVVQTKETNPLLSYISTVTRTGEGSRICFRKRRELRKCSRVQQQQQCRATLLYMPEHRPILLLRSAIVTHSLAAVFLFISLPLVAFFCERR